MSALKNKLIGKILIIKPSSLGDIFHCFAAVTLLHQTFPEAEFDWFVRPEFEEAIAYSPVKISRIIHFPRRRLGKVKSFLPAFLEAVNELRRKKYDLIVDFQGLLRSAVFTSLGRSSRTVGFALPREAAARLAYTQKVRIPQECVHAVDRNLALAEAVTGRKAALPLPPLPPVERFDRRLQTVFREHDIDSRDKLIGMIPGARWDSKRWPPAFFAAVATALLAENPDWKILLIGAPEDRALAQQIVSLASDRRLIAIAGETSVGEMIEAIRHCRFIISNDSGPIHAASALKKTVFAVFGPTDPDKTGPYGDFHHIFQRNLSCIKCLKKACPAGSYQCHDLDLSELINTLSNYMKNGEIR
ncbi:MAG: lipopolysaccharide heptosyltransferase II [Victivallaceae bacterium]|nr:lipopolysaccharide heptosyltransferase II [Victivallaceae bacterium]